MVAGILIIFFTVEIVFFIISLFLTYDTKEFSKKWFKKVFIEFLKLNLLLFGIIIALLLIIFGVSLIIDSIIKGSI